MRLEVIDQSAADEAADLIGLLFYTESDRRKLSKVLKTQQFDVIKARVAWVANQYHREYGGEIIDGVAIILKHLVDSGGGVSKYELGLMNGDARQFADGVGSIAADATLPLPAWLRATK